MMQTKGDLQNVKAPADGDTIILFADCFDPPTLDHSRAAEALLLLHSHWLWLCPLPPIEPKHAEHVRNMTSVLTFDLKRVSTCTVALDKRVGVDGLLEWAQKRFPKNKFVVASMREAVFSRKTTTLCVKFGSQEGVVPPGGTIVPLDKYLPTPADVKQRIASGSDESRHFVRPVWDYIQKRRLYRE